MDPTIRDNPGESPADIPQRLGPYRVLHMLGRGGMGSVYMAVRDDDSFKRRVAIKVIRKGMDTHDVLRRFELERQIVTALNHPNIARVFDAGQTEDGRPFVVMEYVEGLPIDVYCDRNRLSTADRVALFEKVCEAVHAAHQNLIVHRDLKPGNILVTPQGEPKLLDFGIAKILNPELASVTVVTGPEMRVMTPEYASPEQASGEPITTASDVYSLGVLLYELLTGQMPYSFKTRVREEVLRVVREVDPEAPSTRVTKAQEFVDDTGTTRTVSAADIAKARSEEPTRLRRQLQGDLDNIVLMAMHKSPAKRYPSAQALAEDLGRHAKGFPVQARRESFLYSTSRLVRRHRGPVIAGAAILFVALAGAAATAWQAGKAREQQAFAAEQTRRLVQVQNFAADFLEKLQTQIARAEGSMKTREVLTATSIKVLEYLATEFPDDPKLQFVRAQAWRRVGDIQGGSGANRGRTGDALQSYTRAWSLLEHNSGGAPADDLRAAKAEVLVDLAKVEQRSGDAASSAAHIQQAYELVADHNSSPILRTALAKVMLTRWQLQSKDNPDLPTTDLDASLALRRELRREQPANNEYARNVGVALVGVGEHAARNNDLKAALQAFAENRDIRERLAVGADADQTQKRDLITATKFWADTLVDMQRAQEAIGPLTTSFADLQSLARSSPDDARLQNDLANFHESLAHAYESLGDWSRAEDEYRAFAAETATLAAREPDNARVQDVASGAQAALAAFLADRANARAGGQ